MKGIRINLVLVAAGVVIAGVVQAQEKAVLSHQNVSSPTANSSTNITLRMKTEPKLAWGSRTQVSGLFVDLIKPQQTWVMLNPPKPAWELPRPTPRHLLPVTAPQRINDPTVHELDFALLRFSF